MEFTSNKLVGRFETVLLRNVLRNALIGRMSSKRKRDNENLITEIDFTLKEAIHVAGGGNIYCVCFCDVLPSLYTYFATISGRNISLFSIEIDNCLQSLKVFTTEDRDEEYYTG